MNQPQSYPPLLQSLAWQQLQQDLGENTFFYQSANYQFLAIQKKTPLGNYLYLPYGPFIQQHAKKSSIKKCIDHLLSLAKQTNAIFIRLEPQISTPHHQTSHHLLSTFDKKANVAQYFSLNPRCLKKTKDLNPAETWCLDLTADEKDLLTNFSQGTRTRHNTYQKKGLTVEVSKNPDDIKYLIKLQHKLAKEKNIATFSEQYLKTELKQPFASLFLVKYYSPTNAKNASVQNSSQTSNITNIPTDTLPSAPQKTSKPTPKNGEVIAASLFFDYQDTRFYMQSAANLDYRHLPATVALLSHAIFSAKAQGLKNFDFWGIAPLSAKPDHPWYGFTEFKKSFGGYEKTYSGTYDYILNPQKYLLYQIIRKLNLLKRKLFR